MLVLDDHETAKNRVSKAILFFVSVLEKLKSDVVDGFQWSLMAMPPCLSGDFRYFNILYNNKILYKFNYVIYFSIPIAHSGNGSRR